MNKKAGMPRPNHHFIAAVVFNLKKERTDTSAAIPMLCRDRAWRNLPLRFNPWSHL
jgi:hypothetical protein